ncbi:MAG TPA: helix-turn-helix domain-containing protein [Gemmataceae bacterium]|nr:helix-turn-helix domain-containing protein [Gemmataceae bacterium]
MLTPKQAAARIGVSDSLIYEWCSNGALPHYRFGRNVGKRGKILIEETEFEAFLARCRQEGRQDAAPLPPLKHIKMPQLS